MSEFVKIVCDQCSEDVATTQSGKLYGPLRLELRAPEHSQEVVKVDFCCLGHAIEWMDENVGVTVLA